MPFFRVCLSAETESVARISPTRPRSWAFKFSCDSCRETTPHFIYVDEAEQQDTSGGGTRNAVFKCAFCKGTITVAIDADSYGAFVPNTAEVAVLAIEVRGGEPVELELDDQWVVEAEGSGNTFEDADLTEDWVAYDEVAATSLAVTNVEVSFTRAKRAK